MFVFLNGTADSLLDPVHPNAMYSNESPLSMKLIEHLWINDV